MSDDTGALYTTQSSQITQNSTVVATIAKAVASGLLTGSATTLYTSTSKATSIGAICRSKLMSIVFCNTDNATRTVTLYLVPAAGSPAAGNTILSALSLTAGQTYQFDLGDGIPLLNGEMIQGLASTTGVVTHRISLIEYV